jgi:hypothetical protein
MTEHLRRCFYWCRERGKPRARCRKWQRGGEQ